MSDVEPSLEGPPWEEDAPEVEERDPNTDDMFGAPEPAGMREAEAAAAPQPEVPPASGPAAKTARAAPPADDGSGRVFRLRRGGGLDRKSTRLNSSHVKISYAVFCLYKKT